MTLFTCTARRRFCTAAGALVVLVASSALAAPRDTSPLRPAQLPTMPDAPAEVPLTPPAPPQQAPLLWNGGFPGIAPSQASGTGSGVESTPLSNRLLEHQMGLLWASWVAYGRLTGMSFPEWVIASGGSSLFSQRVLFGSVRPK